MRWTGAMVILIALGLVACAPPVQPPGLPTQRTVVVDWQGRRIMSENPITLDRIGAIYPNEWSRWVDCVRHRWAGRGGQCSLIPHLP